MEVQWEGGRDVRCAEQQGPWLKNHVFSHNIKVHLVLCKDCGIFIVADLL